MSVAIEVKATIEPREAISPKETFLANLSDDRAAAIAAVRLRPQVSLELWKRAWYATEGGPRQRIAETIRRVDSAVIPWDMHLMPWSAIVDFLKARGVDEVFARDAVSHRTSKTLSDWIAAWQRAADREPDDHFKTAVFILDGRPILAEPGSILALLDRHPQRANISPFAAGVTASLHAAIR